MEKLLLQDNNKLPKNLRTKLALSVAALFIVLGILIALLTSGANLIILISTTLILAIASMTLIFFFLKPLDLLYQTLLILGKGELDHRINLKHSDELGVIAETINFMAQSLTNLTNQINYDKQLIAYEKSKLEAIIASITDAIIILNLHKQVVMANKAAEELLGISVEEMINRPIEELIKVADDKGNPILSTTYCPISIASQTLGEIKTYKSQTALTLQTSANAKAKIRLVGSHINYPIQYDLGCILVMQNLTKEYSLQEMQIDFVSMASHELRTPLTSITGYISTVLEEAKLSDEHKKFLDRALNSSKQLYTLVDNLLNVSKVERNAFTLNMQPTDLYRAVEQAVEDNKSAAVDKNITLEFEGPAGPIPKVNCDIIRINEVINNLISNAIKYTKESGHIKVGIQTTDNQLIVSVADNGIGIPAESIPHLFNKFYRVPGSLDQMAKGTGLGLYISKSIIELHHGKIWVESIPQKGTTFYFSLPTISTQTQQPTIAQLHTPIATPI